MGLEGCALVPHMKGKLMNASRNVSLWINNDEGLYRMALDCIKRTKNRREAAALMLRELGGMMIHTTPDGYRYTLSGIREGMVGL